MRYLGGERLDWNSRTPHRKLLDSRVINELVSLSVNDRSRVLIVGSPDTQFLSRLLDEGIQVDCWTSSLEDADGLTDHFEADAGLHVVCGDISRITPDSRYDIVVAIAGRIGIATPDSPIQNETQLIEHLSDFVNENGTIVYGVANPFGIREIVGGYDSEFSAYADSYWPTGSTTRREFAIGQIREAFSVKGFDFVAQFALFGGVEDAEVLASQTALAGYEVDEFLGCRAAEAVARIFAGEPTLTDPYLTTRKIIRAGLGAVLEPAVLFVCSRISSLIDKLPEALVIECPSVVGESIVWEMVGTGPQREWIQRLSLNRDSGGFVNETSPTSPKARVLSVESSIEMELLEAARHGDRATFDELLRNYLSVIDSGEVSGASAAYFGLHNATLVAGHVRIIDDSRKFDGSVDLNVVKYMHLRRLARLLAVSGEPHFWEPGLSIDQLVQRIAARAGFSPNGLADQASLLEAAVHDAGLNRSTREGASSAAFEIAQAAALPLGPGGPIPVNLRERINNQVRVEKLITRGTRLDKQAAMLTERQRATDEKRKTLTAQRKAKIASLKSELTVANKEIGRLRSSRSYRWGKAILAPARMWKKDASD